MKLKRTWFFVVLIFILWIVLVFYFRDQLRFIIPYLPPVLGISAILLFAVLGFKATIQQKQRRKKRRIEAIVWELKDQLKELKEQLSKGVITQNEYEQKKKEAIRKVKVAKTRARAMIWIVCMLNKKTKKFITYYDII